MGNRKCIPRKKRRNPLINKCSILFSSALDDKDYTLAASIVYFNVLVLYGKAGIMNALDNANAYISRKNRRRGL